MTAPSLPSCCSFCGKRKSEVRKLMIGIVMTRDGESVQNSICDECLGVQMTVVAFLDRALFDQLVQTARAYKPGDEPPN
jgi:ClpX C4-type zinc finger